MALFLLTYNKFFSLLLNAKCLAMKKLSLFAMALLLVPWFGCNDAAEEKTLSVNDPSSSSLGELVMPPAKDTTLPSGRKNTYLLSARNLRGMFIERSWFPKGYISVPHVHNEALYVTILSGSACLAFGSKMDTTINIKCAGPGSFVVIPADQPHYEWFREDCLMQIEGMGPSNTFFIRQDSAAVKK